MTPAVARAAQPESCHPGKSRDPRRPLLRWFWLALLLVAVAASGCGGCGGRGGDDTTAAWGGMSKEEWLKQYKERQEKESQAAAKAKAEAAKAAEAKRQQAVKKPAAQASKASASAAAPPPPPKPPQSPAAETPDAALADQTLPPPPMLPESIADWQEGDLYIARMNDDLRLIAAVQRYGQETKGDPRAAEALTYLLPPRATDDIDDQAPLASKSAAAKPQNKTPAMRLIESIATALGANGTPRARETLEQMLTGQMPTEHAHTAALAAVKGLVEHPTPENEDVLVRILISPPPSPLLPSRGIAPEEVQQAAVTLLKDAATRRLRTMIAEYFVSPTTSQLQRELLAPLLRDMQSSSLEAQAILYRSPVTDGSTKSTVERYLAQYSSDALGGIFRVPPRQPPIVADPEWPARVAVGLWTPDLCQLIGNRLSLTAALQDAASLATFASTIPNDTVRSTLSKMLDKQWDDGPIPLRNAGLVSRVISEPGFLVLLKAASRKSGGGGRLEAGKYALPNKSTATQLIAARQKRNVQIDNAWLNLIQELAQTHCGRLRDAAAAKAEAIRQSGQPFHTFQPPAGLPVSLHSDSLVFAAYHLDWAAELPRICSTIPADPLSVYYVRIEDRTRLAKMQSYYRRQLRLCETHPVQHGVWLDSLAAESGRRRSVDVFITVANPDSQRLPDDEQKLIIEILSIETRDLSRD